MYRFAAELIVKDQKVTARATKITEKNKQEQTIIRVGNITIETKLTLKNSFKVSIKAL